MSRLAGTCRDCRRLFEEELDFLAPSDREWGMDKSLAQALDWPAG